MSKPVKFRYGIPQGSCLGPTLFIFYINKLFTNINDVKIMMFADDCVLYKNGKNWDDVHQPLQNSLNVYIKWGLDHNLLFNASKTKAMYICTQALNDRMDDPTHFNAVNSEISFVENFSYLGCIIYRELTMVPQYKAIYRRVEQKMFMLCKLRYLLDKQSAVLVYKQAILPYIDYVSFVLVSCTIGMRKELQTLQNDILRLCLRYRLADRVSVEQLHREANLQSVEQRSEFHLLKLLFDYSKKPEHVKPAPRLTRAANKMVLKILNRCYEKYRNSPLYKGNKIWNALDMNVQRLQIIDSFVKHVRQPYLVYRNCFQ